MSHSSILGGEAAEARASGRDTDSLGPSDTSDSGSDVQGERMMPTGADSPDELGAVPVDLSSDSDSSGTGERAGAPGDLGVDGSDILPDHIVGDESLDGGDTFDAGSSEGLDDIEDDLDDGTDEADDETVASAAAGGGAAASKSGRVFKMPPGTLDEPTEPAEKS